MYVQYIQNLCQSTLGTVDHALTQIAQVTAAAYSLELLYA
jgi:hypothetical protein